MQRQRAHYLNVVGDQKLAAAYPAPGYPHYVVIGRNGRVALLTGGGSDQKLAAAVTKALAQR